MGAIGTPRTADAPQVTLRPVAESELAAFKSRMQTAFTQAAREAFPDFEAVIPPDRNIDESLAAPGAEALQAVCDDRAVGGAVTSGEGGEKFLEFIFVDPDCQGRHLGHAIWLALESRHPEATRWTLVTPYHERRNIHFYVNRCGFHITEYYNDRHPDPSFPQEEAGDYPGADGGLFKFEKVMRGAGC